MNKDYRYQLESKKLTGHQPRKLICPNCGKKNWRSLPAVTQLVVPITRAVMSITSIVIATASIVIAIASIVM